ncbi:large terminase [Mycobacteroides chelonae]|uniref:Large terminase n=2 Tax=Mycobacteroides chelonae TaxID=1774 RepID=A0A1S1LMG4_MYCCH|nr:large terminase [Mycobacteroides chelonae]
MLLVVPGADPEPWPTLGKGICDLIRDRAVYGPGSLQGEQYELDKEFEAFIYRAFEIYPKGHPWEGRRRFKRVGLSVRKGLAKTEKQALLAFCELHPDGPTRFDGWDAYGNPVGRPVRSPYIPMLAVSVEQVEELAFGALTYIISEGPDADLFDVSKERICRLDERGREDGKAVALANSPGARDGARTTMNCFDEPHRLYLPRQIEAHKTMDANLPKRPLDDPWSLYVGTAGQPGQGSVMEMVHAEAIQISKGLIERPDLLYLYRTDDGTRDLSVKAERIQAIAEASGPAGEFGPGQFDEIASQWDRPGADKAFLERVWLNRWRMSGSQAFDMVKVEALESDETIPDGAFVTAGFDGARFRDATALTITEISTGRQMLLGCWERPENAEVWEVPEDEVTDLVSDMMSRYQVWRMYCDPPHWTETVASWAARWPDQVVEWHTQTKSRMVPALRSYVEALDSSLVSFSANVWRHVLIRHMGHAARKELKTLDEFGKPQWILQKQDGRLEDKFDAAMAAVLSWTACVDARREGAQPKPKSYAPRRIY